MPEVRLDTLLDDIVSKSTRGRLGRLDQIIDNLPEEEAAKVREQLAECDAGGMWVRPHKAVAAAFAAAGYDKITKSTVEGYRARLQP